MHPPFDIDSVSAAPDSLSAAEGIMAATLLGALFWTALGLALIAN